MGGSEAGTQGRVVKRTAERVRKLGLLTDTNRVAHRCTIEFNIALYDIFG